ncbi:MAG: tetratricopeptide repeat protein [Verrucomicrobiota bacterium]
MRKLDWPDTLHLEAAVGWLELGNPIEANAELDCITPELRGHPQVLALRSEIYFREKLWTNCVEVSDALVRIQPDNTTGWIHRSYALHELKRTREAFENLLPAAAKFSDLWTIPYNLACYCAQLNRLEEATDWFKKAIAIDGEIVRSQALDDEDLKPLWDSMNGTLWRKE